MLRGLTSRSICHRFIDRTTSRLNLPACRHDLLLPVANSRHRPRCAYAAPFENLARPSQRLDADARRAGEPAIVLPCRRRLLGRFNTTSIFDCRSDSTSQGFFAWPPTSDRRLRSRALLPGGLTLLMAVFPCIVVLSHEIALTESIERHENALASHAHRCAAPSPVSPSQPAMLFAFLSGYRAVGVSIGPSRGYDRPGLAGPRSLPAR